MLRKFNSIFFFSFWFFISVNANEPCLLNMADISSHSPIFRPFILTPEGNLYPSEKDVVKLMHGSKAQMTCENNYFKQFDRVSTLQVTCNDDSFILENDKKSHKFKDLSCDLKIIEEMKQSVHKCAKQGLNYLYYDVKKQHYLILAEVCYDDAKNELNFVRTYMSKKYPPVEMQAATVKKAPGMNIDHRIEVLNAFRTDSATKAMSRILGDDFNLAFNSIQRVKFLPKIFYNDQLQGVSSFPSGIVPMWKTVADGNWKSLMSDVGNLGKTKDNTLEVILGTRGTLSINGRKLQLSDDKFPILQYAWVIVHEKATKSAVAIVTINNPFITMAELKSQVVCENICDKVKWLRRLVKNNNQDRVVYGYTFCCSMDKFNFFSLDSKVEKVLV